MHKLTHMNAFILTNYFKLDLYHIKLWNENSSNDMKNSLIHPTKIS